MKNLAIALVAALCVVAVTRAAAGSIEQGRLALERQDYPSALMIFRAAAAAGDPVAQFNLGLMYDRGYAVNQSHTQAAYWYRLAAEQGHTNAQVALGYMYQSGQGVAQDSQLAFEWLVRATEQSMAQAPLLIPGQPSNAQDGLAEAFDRARARALEGDAEAMLQLGDLYFHGTGVERDQTAAYQWYLLAAQQGVTRAKLNLGAMYASGEGVARNPNEAIRWFEAAIPGQIARNRGDVRDAGCFPGRHAVLPRIMNMSYHQARVRLIESGWQPMALVNPAQPAAADLFGNARYFVQARGYTEVESCAGTGLAPCRFLFRDTYGNTLLIGSVGEEIPGTQTATVDRIEFLCDDESQWRVGFGQGNFEYSIVKGQASVWIDCPTRDGSREAVSQVSFKLGGKPIEQFDMTVDNVRYRAPIRADSPLGDDNFVSLLNGLQKTDMVVRFDGQEIVFPRNNVEILPEFGKPDFQCNLFSIEVAPVESKADQAPPPPAVPPPQSDRAYVAQIRQCIVKNMNYAAPPRTGMVNPVVSYRVDLNDVGEVTAVSLRRVSGNPAFDRNVSLALWQCSPMPVPPGGRYPAFMDIAYAMYDDEKIGDRPANYEAYASSNPAPRYPVAAMRRGAEGTVVLRVLVLTDGEPTSIEVHQSSGDRDLDQAAVQTVGNWRFQPAIENGRAVNQWVKVPVTFRLRDRSTQTPPPIAIGEQVYEPCASVADCVANMLTASFPLDLANLQRYADDLGMMASEQRGDRNRAREFNQIGLKAFNAGDYRSAAAAFRRAADADPADVEVMANLGAAFIKDGQFRSAGVPLGTALILSPRRTATWIPVGELFVGLDEFDSGVRSFLIAYQYSRNRTTTIRFFAQRALDESQEQLRRAYQAAFDIISASNYGYEPP